MQVRYSGGLCFVINIHYLRRLVENPGWVCFDRSFKDVTVAQLAGPKLR
jgi:hypothetical protein